MVFSVWRSFVPASEASPDRPQQPLPSQPRLEQRFTYIRLLFGPPVRPSFASLREELKERESGRDLVMLVKVKTMLSFLMAQNDRGEATWGKCGSAPTLLAEEGQLTWIAD